MSRELNDWNKFKAARNTTNNAIKQAKTKYYKEAWSTHKDNPRKLWSTINEACSRKSRSTTVKSIEIGQHTVTDSARISEAFNEHFSQIGSKLVDSLSESTNSFPSYVSQTNQVFELKPTCPNEVKELLLKLSERKATGLDKISNKFIRISAPVISDSRRMEASACYPSVQKWIVEWR